MPRSSSATDGPRLGAVLFDWAGTTIDHGSRAPAAVFVEIFRRRDITVSEADARGPMGRAKRDHIAQVLQLPHVAAAWTARTGQPPTEADVDALYADFLPLQREVLAKFVDLIPGAAETVASCRRRGLRIGSTTGYTRELMQVVETAAAAQGYQPDVILTADDARQGRPAPWLNFRALEALDVYPPFRAVVVDDTPVGIAAGRHAGCWTVAVSRTGNALALSLEAAAALPPDELTRRLHAIRQEFLAVGADFVVESVADLPPVLDQIEQRLAAGERPPG